MRNDMPLPRDSKHTTMSEWQQYYINMRNMRDRARGMLLGVAVACGTLGATIGGVIGYLIGVR